MRILLDEPTPRPLKREFSGLDATHVADLHPLIPAVRALLARATPGNVYRAGV